MTITTIYRCEDGREFAEKELAERHSALISVTAAWPGKINTPEALKDFMVSDYAFFLALGKLYDAVEIQLRLRAGVPRQVTAEEAFAGKQFDIGQEDRK